MVQRPRRIPVPSLVVVSSPRSRTGRRPDLGPGCRPPSHVVEITRVRRSLNLQSAVRDCGDFAHGRSSRDEQPAVDD